MANPKIQLRHDTSTNWQTQNPVLLEGEVAIETDSNKVKIGNGTDNYNTLPYITDQTKIDLDYSNADYQPVNKAGGTMTGALKIRASDTRIEQNNITITKGTKPSSAKYWGIMFNDASDDNATWQSKRLGYIEQVVNTDGSVELNMGPLQNVANATSSASLRLRMTQAGVASCSFPNTICCDGQWVHSYTQFIGSDTTIDAKGSLQFSLANYLPNDGKIYEVRYYASGKTGSTSGNYAEISVWGLTTDNGCRTAFANTNSSAAAAWCASGVILIGTDRIIHISQIAKVACTCTQFRAYSYRRIGTNA